MSQLPREELADILFQEVDGYLPQIQTNLSSLSENMADSSLIGETHRLFHNIKGAASQVGFMELSNSARMSEDVLNDVLENETSLTQEDLTFISTIYDTISGFCHSPDHSFDAEAEHFASVLAGSSENTADGGASTEEVREECLVSLRSILPFLQELAEFSSDKTTVFPESIFKPMSRAISVLASCSKTAELHGHQQLLNSFLLLLKQIRASSSLSAAEISTFLKEVISYLDMVFSIDADKAEPIIERITERFADFSNLVATGERKEAKEAVEDGGTEFLPPENNLFDDLLVEEDALEVPPIEEVFFEEESDLDSEEDKAQELTDEQQELAEIFQAECEEHMLVIDRTLNTLESSVYEDRRSTAELGETLAEMRRAVHTLKGAAGMTGFIDLSSCAHGLEDLLDWLHDESDTVTREDVLIIANTIDTIDSLSSDMSGDYQGTVEANIKDVSNHLDRRKAEGQTEQPVEKTVVVEEGTGERVEEDTMVAGSAGNVRVKLEDLDELGSIEGELVVARGTIEKLVEQLGQSLGDLSTARDALGRKTQELEVGFEAQSLYGFGPSPATGALPVMEETVSSLTDFDPIELDRYSQLNLIIRSLNEISIDVNAIHSQINGVAREIRGQVAKQQLAMGVMQEKLMRIRMTPLSSISRGLYQTVRQTAAKLGKDVQLMIKGEDVYMDRYIWSRILDPMMHLLRNSIDHGIEDAETRVEKGKAATGLITVNAVQRNRFVVLQIIDDGKGVDIDKVRATLIDQGVISTSEQLGEEELMRYLFTPSFSTKDDVTQISGRGVGLDVVQKNIQELRGNVKIENRPGEGLTFELYIPVTLSINRALIVEVSDNLFAVPIQDILEVRRFSNAELQVEADETMQWREKPISFIDLASRLQLPSTGTEEFDGQLALLLETDEEYHAFRVDSIVEQREIVIKDLGSHLKYVRGVNGVTLTGDGEIIPILNVSELTSESPLGALTVASQPMLETNQDEIQVLIVDDSISVRYSISRMIEGQGWVAYQAVDGLDALEKLEELSPDVIVLDIEMPRMNGYEFMSSLRNDQRFSAIPVVMLTSRASEKHRQKAYDLGVNAYVTKPYEEDDFVTLLRSTVSSARE